MKKQSATVVIIVASFLFHLHFDGLLTRYYIILSFSGRTGNRRITIFSVSFVINDISYHHSFRRICFFNTNDFSFMPFFKYPKEKSIYAG